MFIQFNNHHNTVTIMATSKWILDPTHSEVQFKVKHLMIATVTGYFKDFNVVAETADEQFGSVEKVLFTADVNSVNTNNDQRDTHLKSADFFDAQNHGEVRFVGTGYTNVHGDEYELQGELTIRGITKPVTVKVEFGGIVVDPYGQTKAGFTINGKISRKEFGLTWNAVTEAGSVVVSDEIKLLAEIQLVKQN